MNNIPPHIVKSHLVWMAKMVRLTTTTVVKPIACSTCDEQKPSYYSYFLFLKSNTTITTSGVASDTLNPIK